MPKICATIEARMTSTRLPGKILLPAAGKPLLEHMVERLRRVPSLQGVIIATTTNATDDPVEDLAQRLGVGCHRGSEHDVRARVLEAAQDNKVDVIVETTGDCPLIDPAVIERTLQVYLAGGADYVCNAIQKTYPRGMDVDVFSTESLADAASRFDDPKSREHVSLAFYRNPDRYRCVNVAAPPELTAPDVRLTVDEQADYELVRAVFENLYEVKPDFSLTEILAFLSSRPDIASLNRHVRQKVV